MGIRGLTTFLERKCPHIDIDVLRQIRFWKRDDKMSPIIVIDFVALSYTLFDAKDLICGGRFCEIFDNFENMLKKLTDIGATLVFFYRLTIDKFSDNWIAKCRQKFSINIKMYDEIGSGKSLDEIAAVISKEGTPNPPLASSELNVIAQKYGKCYYSTDCDLEMASFAKRNNARAIVSDSSDFFIFDGNFKFWSAKEFKFDPRNQNKIKTAQFDREGIVKSCGINAIHRPLFATLLGNELADDHDLRNDLKQFQKSLGKERFKKVAQYVKNAKRHKSGLLDFERISEDVFGACEDEYVRFLESSVNLYNLDDVPEKEHNEIFSRLSSTPYNRDILKILSGTRVFLLSFYDMRGKCVTETLPMLFTNWHQRKSGILKVLFENDSCGKVFAKFKHDEDFRLVSCEGIKPKFTVPEIEDLYCSSEAADIKWEMLAFIMEFDDAIVTAIQSLPRAFRLVCTTVLVLVKGGFFTKDEADGALFTMHMVETDVSTVRKMKYFGNLIEDHIRAAHVFNNTIDQVRQNFSIAGLLSEIQPSRFDGVYFQHVMSLTEAERKKMMTPCHVYRIYDNCNN